MRCVRIPREQAREFWTRVLDLANDYAQLPRGGDVVYGFAAGLYPTDHPRTGTSSSCQGPVRTYGDILSFAQGIRARRLPASPSGCLGWPEAVNSGVGGRSCWAEWRP